MPQQMDRVTRYFDRVAQDYHRRVERGLLRHLRRRERRTVEAFAQLDEPALKTLLDVGCGGGYYSLLARAAGLRVTAVDVSASMLEGLRGRVHELIQADLTSLQAGPVYDVVICAGVMDFVSDPELAFSNLAKQVKPGGRLIVLTARRWPFGFAYRIEKWVHRIRVNLFSVSWFCEQAKENGLDLTGSAFPLPTNMVLRYERKEAQ